MSENEREIHPSNKQQEIKRYTCTYDYIYLQTYCKNTYSTTDNCSSNFACYKQSKGLPKLVRPIV